MNRSHRVILYNVMFPVWMLVFWPSFLWLLLIPANYLIDRFVLKWTLGDLPERGAFCRRHTWKICLAGFAADLAGALLLFAVLIGSSGAENGTLLDRVEYGVGFNPFYSIWSFLVIALAVAATGVLIFFTDRALLKRSGLSCEQAGRSALRLALITAPYLYFLPSSILYR